MADEKDLIDQDEIEKILQQAGSARPKPQPAKGGSAAQPQSDAIDQNDIEALLNGAAGKPASQTSRPPSTPSAAGDKMVGQDDVVKLAAQAKKVPSTTKSPASAEKPIPSENEGEILPDDMEYLLRQAEEALASIEGESSAEVPPGVAAFRLEEFAGAPASSETATLDLIRDVELDLKIELGRTHMYLEDILKLRRGSVVPLDKLAGDPVDIYVNGRLIARGEVLVLNDNFCVRVAELIAGAGSG